MLPHACKHSLIFIVAFLVGVLLHGIVILICIFPVTKEVVHFPYVYPSSGEAFVWSTHSNLLPTFKVYVLSFPKHLTWALPNPPPSLVIFMRQILSEIRGRQKTWFKSEIDLSLFIHLIFMSMYHVPSTMCHRGGTALNEKATFLVSRDYIL